MNRTNSIFLFEWRHLMSRPSTYLYLFTFFGIALFSLLGTGGFFDGVETDSQNVRLINSPHEIIFIMQYFNKFLLFLIPAIIGANLNKDFSSRTFHILYSYPLSKRAYWTGKFFSGFTLVVCICLAIGVAFILGELMLGTQNPRIGRMNLWGYFYAYIAYLIPNLLVVSAFVFLAVLWSRNLYVGFFVVLFFILFQTTTVHRSTN